MCVRLIIYVIYLFVLLFLLDGMQFMCVQIYEHEIWGGYIMQDYTPIQMVYRFI